MKIEPNRTIMKIEANISFHQPEGDICGCDISLGKDFIENHTNNADSILEYVSNELHEMFGHSFDYDDFEVTNMQELIEKLSSET